jgi:uncharacterized ferritin-like protein (DUF455 family)
MQTPVQTSLDAGLELRAQALQWLCGVDPEAKAEQVRHCDTHSLRCSPAERLAEPLALPGLPERPVLVGHTEIRHGSVHTIRGRASLLHAVAHIELNAIHLALDAIWRFPDMPEAFYWDWLRVAQEEAHHFMLLQAHLRTLGFGYGDFPAHQGLWTMVEKTRHDRVARMALVPRTLEARGLDASPPMRAKLAAAGDTRACEILDTILADEIGHVAVGNRWYRWLCEREGLDPLEHYRDLLGAYDAPRPRPPFNFDARRQAGFTEQEMALLG